MLLICLCQIMVSQIIVDDFESGNLDNWQIELGNAAIERNNPLEGDFSVRLFDDLSNAEEEVRIIQSSFQESFGAYEFLVNADGIFSDANFYFQYVDANNYYQLSHKPAGTDNPELVLFKLVNGEYTELSRIDAIAPLNEPIFFLIVRNCDGGIHISAQGQIVMQVNDLGIMTPGSIALGGWDENTYFDRIRFTGFNDRRDTVMTTICSGESVLLGDNMYNQTGIYEDTVSGISTGCFMITTLLLDVLKIDTSFLSVELCTDETIEINSVVYDVPGSYLQILQNQSGCDSLLLLEIIGIPLISNSLDTSFCPGDTLFISDLTIFAPGEYSLSYEGSTSSGCDSVVFISASILDTEYSLGPDVTLCPGGSITLDALYEDALWNTGNTGRFLTINNSGTYAVTIVNPDGCLESDSINVAEQCETSFYSPNVFSPNSDNLNDVWQMFFNQPPQSFSIYIFSRWGNKVFTSSQYDFQWGGYLDDQPLSTGVYTWIAIIDNQSYTGDITLIR